MNLDHQLWQNSERTERIRQLITDWLQRHHRGEEVSVESLIQAHPELVPEVAEELELVQMLRSNDSGADRETLAHHSSPTSSSSLTIRCPKCRVSAKLPADASFDDITCSGCGSHFGMRGDRAETGVAGSAIRLGQFELIEQIGLGTFGAVWKARDTELDRTVAVKIPRPGKLDDYEVKQFLREARAVAQLNHPNIISVHEVGREEDIVFIVSDFVQGIPLSEWLIGQQPTFREAAELCAKISAALHHAHEAGVIHRDLKPENIMVDPRGEPHLMDFGLARRMAGDISIARDGQLLGTPAYMSPEQAKGKAHQADRRSDIYSLGVILFQLLTGELPFRGNTRMLIHQLLSEDAPRPRRLNNAVPKDLETICLKCLEKDPAKRYASAEEVADDLGRYLNGEPIQARPITPLARTWRWSRRNPTLASLVALAALLLVSTSIATSWLAAALSSSQRNLTRATKAELDATRSSYDALVAQAQAGRYSGRAGHRFKSLEAISHASQLIGPLNLRDQQILKLRNEAIACMALADLRVADRWEGTAARVATVDAGFQYYVHRDPTEAFPGTLCVRGLPDNRQLFRLPGFGLPAWSPRLSPDGRFLAVKYHHAHQTDIHFYVWDLKRREPILKVPDGIHGVAMDFSPDSQLLVVGRKDGTIDRYDLTTAQSLESLDSGAQPTSIRYHPNGTKLAVASLSNRSVELRNTESGEIIASFAHPDGVREICWSPDGRLLASACLDHRCYVWDTQRSEQPPLFELEGHRDRVINVAMNRGGNLLASTSWDGTTRLWDLGSGRQLVSVPGGALRFSADEQRLAFTSAAEDGVWDVATGRECRTMISYAPRGRLWHVAVSPDGQLIAATTSRGVQLWDLATGKEAAFLPIGPTMSSIFHPSGKELVTSGQSGLFRWPIDETVEAGSRRVRIGPPVVLDGRSLQDGMASLSGDGRRIVVDMSWNEAAIFELESPGRRILLKGHAGVNHVAISSDGNWVATGTFRGQGVKVWRGESGRPVKDLIPDAGHTQVSFTPNGDWLATNTARELVFWHVGSWQPGQRIVNAENANVEATTRKVCFSPDGEVMAVARSPYLVRLVKTPTGRELATLEAPDAERVASYCFSADGSQLILATQRHVCVWDLRRVRHQLAQMDLDWDLPPYPPASEQIPDKLVVDVELGS